MSQLYNAASVLASYATNRNALVQEACTKAAELSSQRKRIKSTTDLQLLQSYVQVVSNLVAELNAVRQSIKDLYRQKSTADEVVKSSVPYVPLTNPRPYLGLQGPTGPAGPTVVLPVDVSPQPSSSNLVTSGGVYQRCVDVTTGTTSSVLLGTAEGDSTVVVLCHFNAQLYSNYSVVDNGYYSFTYPELSLYKSAHLSPNTYKFGVSSLRCTGNGDCVRLDTTQLPTLGTGDFTVEVWANFEVFRTTNQCVLAIGSQFSLSLTPNGSAVSVSVCDVSESWSYAFTLNTWYNFTVVRTVGTVSVFVNGALLGSNNQMSGSVAQSVIVVGNGVSDVSQFVQGYVDELRVSFGVARYNQSFTCQEHEFPDVYSPPTVSSGQVWTNGKQLLLKSGTGWKRAVTVANATS